ncbi:MAG: 2-oxoglutarate and iron-dependent oxygenase domain-containing protein, partial [Gammaproteobacteria bacterium]
MTDRIPTLSLHDADSPAFVTALGEAYTRSGFVIIADHGIPHGLIDRFLDLYKT